MPPTPRQTQRLDALARLVADALGDGRYEQAHALASEALSIAPDLPPALAARASAAVRLRRLEEAEADITRALRSHPAPPPQWKVTLALVRRAQDRLDDALELLRAAHRDYPRAQIVTSNLAEILATTRRHDEAYRLLRSAVDQGADRPGLLAQFGRVCRLLGRQSEAVDLLRAAARSDGHPVSGRKQLAFELGHLLDSLGEFDEAFEAFSLANALETRSIDMEAHARLTDEICRTWTRDRIARLPDNPGAGEGCVFIVGMRRSGTTLAEQILAAHPRVAPGGELPWLRAEATPLDPGPMKTLGLAPGTERVTPERVRAIGESYLARAEQARAGEQVFTDKMPANHKLLAIVQLALPRARAVWCRRDPLDTCLSCYMQPFNDNSYCRDLRLLARYYHDCDRLSTHWAAHLDLPIHPLRYEMLVAEPERETRALLAAAGLEFDEACLRFQESDRTARTASTDQVARSLYTSSVGRAANYRHRLGALIDELRRLGHDV